MTTNPTFTVQVKGKDITFTSAFPTLARAYWLLDALENKNQFTKDLLAAARARRVSTKQVAWIHKLATDRWAETAPAASRFTVQGLDLSEIIGMLDHAFECQKKFPRITIDNVAIIRCGNRSSYEGCANIKFGDEWAGRINRDGSVTRGNRYAWEQVEDVLRELARDPQQVLQQEGIATGVCCYCSRGLSDKRSRDVGYGPICAEKYGLPWGDAVIEETAQIVRRDR